MKPTKPSQAADRPDMKFCTKLEIPFPALTARFPAHFATPSLVLFTQSTKGVPAAVRPSCTAWGMNSKTDLTFSAIFGPHVARAPAVTVRKAPKVLAEGRRPDDVTLGINSMTVEKFVLMFSPHAERLVCVAVTKEENFCWRT